MEQELKKRDEESRIQYIYRLATMKDHGELDMTWDELTDVLNDQLGCHFDSATYRKPYTQAMTYYNEVFANKGEDELVRELREAKQELYKERTRLRDERNQFNRQLREEARKESFMDALRDVLVEQCPVKVMEPKHKGDTDCEAIVCLSDMHVGVTASNLMNDYDHSVLHNRLAEYLENLKEIQERHHIGVCPLCLLGDQISGSIHASITATNNMNTVQQIKFVCREISWFLYQLSGVFGQIYIYSVSGNHSRVNSNKEDNIPGDNLDDLIPFYLEAATASNSRILVMPSGDASYHYNQLFKTKAGRDVVIVHGDLDSMDKVAGNMTQIYGRIPDIILMGHMHHSAYNTIGKTRVIQCGCLSGADSYAFNKRLFAPVEQTVVITSNRRTVECIYNVTLDHNEYAEEEDDD